jgi:hypothetical protein
MGAEADTFVGELAELGEREDLEASAIGEHGAGPADEFVQASESGDEVMAGAEVEMVGVAQDDLRALLLGPQFFEDLLGDGFDRALRAYGHEDRGFYGLMREVDARAAGAGGVGAEEFETEGHSFDCRSVRMLNFSSLFARIWTHLSRDRTATKMGHPL